MADEGNIQDLEAEWCEFLAKFHADNEASKQRLHKVKKSIVSYRNLSHILLIDGCFS